MSVSPHVLNAFEAWAKNDKKKLAKIRTAYIVNQLLLKHYKLQNQ